MRNNSGVPVGRDFVGHCQKKDDCLWWESKTGSSNGKEKAKNVTLWTVSVKLLGAGKPLSAEAVVLRHK